MDWILAQPVGHTERKRSKNDTRAFLSTTFDHESMLMNRALPLTTEHR
jgi:hypothetical protein